MYVDLRQSCLARREVAEAGRVHERAPVERERERERERSLRLAESMNALPDWHDVLVVADTEASYIQTLVD